MRSWYVLPSVILLGLAGCDVAAAKIARLRGLEPSPFALFGRDDMRAGIAFARLDAGARREQKMPFRCESLWDDFEKCSLVVDPGTMVAIVDPRGRIVRLAFITKDTLVERIGPVASHRAAVLENTVRSMRAAWDSVRPGRPGALQAGQAEFRWADAEGAWSAKLWHSSMLLNMRGEVTRQMPMQYRKMFADSIADTPDSIAITNDSVYVAWMRRRPEPRRDTVATRQSTPAAVAPAAVPRHTPREKLAFAGRDLEMLVRAQEEYHREHRRHAARIAELFFIPNDSVVIDLRLVGSGGWTARAMHRSLPEVNCVVFAGTVGRPPRTVRDGLGAPAGYVACDQL